LGAKRINEAVLGLTKLWADRAGVAIYHVVGSRDAEWAQVAAGELALGSASGGIVYIQVRYEEHLELVYAACDVAVCRAGANTIAELTVTGTPSVLIPLPGAPGDHQSANAAVLTRAGAAVLLEDSSVDSERLGGVLQELLSDPERLGSMSAAALTLGRPDAAEAVASLAESHARTRRLAA
jgi:UDP-N-acetylglucosamine--N-acetylmuramyl-(pentapeptide) pyrophosphoryl-undecaprenol N-acetylglucosamine transferase